MKEDKAKIQFVSFVVKECQIIFREQTNSKLSINFDASGVIDKIDHLFILSLTTKVKTTDKSIEIKVVSESVFAYHDGADIEEYKSSYFTINAPAIIFPYVRAYISTLTSLSGVSTILLPTFNLAPLGESLKENITIKN